ncbi:MAG TPA: SCO family protein [Terracidiphilus sp.]|jgi:protein SCO1/2|nr:SCO family protein [Terracidiphilus sp.]
MRKSPTLLVIAVLLGTIHLRAAEEHKARGMVLIVDKTHHSLIVSCEAIPGYMEAMEMSFVVRDQSALAALKVGTTIDFHIVENGKVAYADQIQVSNAASHEPEPMEAGALTALNRALKPSAAAQVVPEGQPVPDFALIDQAGRQIHLAQFQGKVVALTFGYSRCPNPQYCFRMSNNLAHVERRLRARHKEDLVLITIMIDPDHDRGKTLSQYADTWKADAEVWHFLTGPLEQIRQIAAMFGMNFWSSDGLLTHPLHTVIIDRKGRLAANIEGNQFTPDQLGDLVETVMNRPT